MKINQSLGNCIVYHTKDTMIQHQLGQLASSDLSFPWIWQYWAGFPNTQNSHWTSSSISTNCSTATSSAMMPDKRNNTSLDMSILNTYLKYKPVSFPDSQHFRKCLIHEGTNNTIIPNLLFPDTLSNNDLVRIKIKTCHPEYLQSSNWFDFFRNRAK